MKRRDTTLALLPLTCNGSTFELRLLFSTSTISLAHTLSGSEHQFIFGYPAACMHMHRILWPVRRTLYLVAVRALYGRVKTNIYREKATKTTVSVSVACSQAGLDLVRGTLYLVCLLRVWGSIRRSDSAPRSLRNHSPISSRRNRAETARQNKTIPY